MLRFVFGQVDLRRRLLCWRSKGPIVFARAVPRPSVTFFVSLFVSPSFLHSHPVECLRGETRLGEIEKGFSYTLTPTTDARPPTPSRIYILCPVCLLGKTCVDYCALSAKAAAPAVDTARDPLPPPPTTTLPNTRNAQKVGNPNNPTRWTSIYRRPCPPCARTRTLKTCVCLPASVRSTNNSPASRCGRGSADHRSRAAAAETGATRTWSTRPSSRVGSWSGTTPRT